MAPFIVCNTSVFVSVPSFCYVIHAYDVCVKNKMRKKNKKHVRKNSGDGKTKKKIETQLTTKPRTPMRAGLASLS